LNQVSGVVSRAFAGGGLVRSVKDSQEKIEQLEGRVEMLEGPQQQTMVMA
jgi:hypothetical protein